MTNEAIEGTVITNDMLVQDDTHGENCDCGDKVNSILEAQAQLLSSVFAEFIEEHTEEVKALGLDVNPEAETIAELTPATKFLVTLANEFFELGMRAERIQASILAPSGLDFFGSLASVLGDGFIDSLVLAE